MLRTNLATRPFYNERPVYAVLVLGALLVALLTLFNVWELVSLSRRDAALRSRVEQAETDAARFRQEAARARASVDREQLEAVLEASREANGLIDQRVFSWTRLLNQLEETLPPDSRIRAIKQGTGDEGLHIELVLLARRAEDVEAFVNSLEATASFQGVFTSLETVQEDGLLEVTLGGTYAESERKPQAAPASPATPARDVRGNE
jgi:Tfp pilus assembly protein PilN